MLCYKFSNLMRIMFYDKPSEQRPVISISPSVDLFYLGRDVWLARNNIQGLLSKTIIEWICPHGMADVCLPGTRVECKIFVSATKMFSDYLNNNEGTLKSSATKMSEMLHTVITVVDDTMHLNTHNEALRKFMKNNIKEHNIELKIGEKI